MPNEPEYGIRSGLDYLSDRGEEMVPLNRPATLSVPVSPLRMMNRGVAPVNAPVSDYAANVLNLLSQIQRNQTPTSDMNVNDFASPVDPTTQAIQNAVPGADTPSGAYYSGYTASPVGSDNLSGRYFGTMPVVTGGSALFPFQLRDARMRVLQNAAVNQQKDIADQETKFFDRFKIPEGKPAYQKSLNETFQDKFYNPVSSLFQKYGAQQALAILNDQSQPITQQLMKDYVNVEQSAKAQTNLDAVVGKIQSELASGKVLSTATSKLYNGLSEADFIDQFNKGKLTQEQINAAPQVLDLYSTLDGKLDKLKGFIDKDVETYYQQGIMDKDGKLLHPSDGTAFYSAVKRSLTDDKYIDNVINNVYLPDANLAPQYKHPDQIKNYLKALIPNDVIEGNPLMLRPRVGTKDKIGRLDVTDQDVSVRKSDISAVQNKQDGALNAFTTVMQSGKLPSDIGYLEEADMTPAEKTKFARKNADGSVYYPTVVRLSYETGKTVFDKSLPGMVPAIKNYDYEISDETTGNYFGINSLYNLIPGQKKISNEQLAGIGIKQVGGNSRADESEGELNDIGAGTEEEGGELDNIGIK